MAASIAPMVFTAICLLFTQQAQGSGNELSAPICTSTRAMSDLLECRTSFLARAGQNFTEDCEDGIVEEFMGCVKAIEECANATAFLEKALYDFYGCMDVELPEQNRVQKRGVYVCSTVCGYSCSIACSVFTGRCYYVCGRRCYRYCRYVGKRSVPEIAPEDDGDLAEEEREYMDESRNLCSDCVCSINVDGPRSMQDQQLIESSAVEVGSFSSLLLFLCYVLAIKL